MIKSFYEKILKSFSNKHISEIFHLETDIWRKGDTFKFAISSNILEDAILLIYYKLKFRNISETINIILSAAAYDALNNNKLKKYFHDNYAVTIKMPYNNILHTETLNLLGTINNINFWSKDCSDCDHIYFCSEHDIFMLTGFNFVPETITKKEYIENLKQLYPSANLILIPQKDFISFMWVEQFHML